MEEKVMNLMRKGGITCLGDTPIRDVAQIMVVNSLRYCLVINERHEVMGVISARSILKGFDRDHGTTTAKDILLPYTITITPNSPLKEAIDVMSKKRIEHLIVVSDRPGSKAVLGLLHAEDIISRMVNDEEK